MFLQLFPVVCIFPSFVTIDEFSVRLTKLIQGLVSHEPRAYLSDSDFLTKSNGSVIKRV